jgi:hypothetical protein
MLLDVEASKPTLITFIDFVDEELSTSMCPGVDELYPIDDISVLVAHLSYNYRLRLELLVLLTPVEMYTVIEEEVVVSVACIDYLVNKLGILQDGSDSQVLWVMTKESVWNHLVSHGRDVSQSTVKSMFQDCGHLLSSELSSQFPTSTVCIFEYAHSIGLVASMVGSGDTRQGYFSRYLDNLVSLPDDFFTNRYKQLLDEVKGLMLESSASQLTLDKVDRVFEITVWQSRCFIYHVQAMVVGGVGWDIGQGHSGGSCLPVERQDSEESDGTEKVDISEKEMSNCRCMQQMPDTFIHDLLVQIVKSVFGQTHFMAQLFRQAMEFTDIADQLETFR